MKDNSRVCNKCGKFAIFIHEKTGWCSSVTLIGKYNQFGRCAVKKIDSPQLKLYEQNFKGEK